MQQFEQTYTAITKAKENTQTSLKLAVMEYACYIACVLVGIYVSI